jgi:hypothetical protein
MAKLNYYEIGHHGRRSLAWVWQVDYLEVQDEANDSGDTHFDIWGPEAANRWRGRFELKRKLVSVLPPDRYATGLVLPPEGLIIELKEMFGSDIDIRFFGGEGHDIIDDNPPQLNDAFWKWFGESVVRNEDGSPKIVYHGSASKTGAFDQFKPSASTRGGAFGSSRIVRATTWFFTESKEMAYQFAAARADYGDTRTVYQVYLSIKNQLDATRKLDAVEKDLAKVGVPMVDRFGDRLSKSTVWQLFDDPGVVAKLEAGGYDGAIISESDAARSFKLGKDKQAQRTWVAFKPTQIKHINNRGTWDGGDPVMMNPPSADELKLGIKRAVKAKDYSAAAALAEALYYASKGAAKTHWFWAWMELREKGGGKQ